MSKGYFPHLKSLGLANNPIKDLSSLCLMKMGEMETIIIEINTEKISDEIEWVFKTEVQSLKRICKIEITQGSTRMIG